MSYEVIKIRTVLNEDGGLSFFESEHDISFAIKHFYCIYETKQENQRNFYSKGTNKLLLFCPYGKVEIVVSSGGQKSVIFLTNPSIGLVLYDGIWDRLIWKQANSVLCVASSEALEEYSVFEEKKNLQEA